MPDPSIENLVQALARLPGLGPRSARRAVLQLVKRRESLMDPLLAALQAVRDTITTCSDCGNIDVADPCHVCTDPRRDRSRICVVEEVADLWALERGGIFNGLYHILGGVLSALDGVGPDDLRIPRLISRCRDAGVTEVILATSATVDGQTTAFYIADHLDDCQVTVSGLAHGVPIGGELDYLDDGTLATALRERRPLGR